MQNQYTYSLATRPALCDQSTLSEQTYHIAIVHMYLIQSAGCVEKFFCSVEENVLTVDSDI